MGDVVSALNPFDSGFTDENGTVGGQKAGPVVQALTDIDYHNARDRAQSGLDRSSTFTDNVIDRANKGMELQHYAGQGMQDLGQALAAGNGAGNLAGASAGALALQQALAGQNSVGVQNANTSGMQGLAGQLGGLGGVQNLGSVFSQQQALANQLGDVAAGRGPNPAMAALANATGQNVQQQAALMAAQRGAGANAGLLARQAAMQGAGIQQQAAGQAAQMQANQQLGAMGQLGSQQAQMGQLANQQLAAQMAQQQAIQNATAQQIGAQSGANQVAGGLAAQQVGLQQNALGQMANQGNTQINQGQAGVNAHNQATQGYLGQIGQGIASQNQAAIGSQGLQNQAGFFEGQNKQKATGATWNAIGQVSGIQGLTGGGSPMQAGSMGPQTSGMGGSMPAGASDLPVGALMMANQGGVVKSYSDGGQVAGGQQQQKMHTYEATDPTPFMNATSGIVSSAVGNIRGYSDGGSVDTPNGPKSSYARALSGQSLMPVKKENYMNQGGKVPAMVSPGEGYIPPKEVGKVATGKKDPIQAAKVIPGKAKVQGDSIKNDTVPAQLEEGGIVLPRSVMNAKHPHWAAHKFVQEVMAKEGLKRKK